MIFSENYACVFWFMCGAIVSGVLILILKYNDRINIINYCEKMLEKINDKNLTVNGRHFLSKQLIADLQRTSHGIDPWTEPHRILRLFN